MMQNLKMLLLAVSDGKAEEDTSIAAKMMYLSCQQSKLRIMFESEGIDRQSRGQNLMPPMWLQVSLNCSKRSHTWNI